jgi:PhoPQ-activated pathogenicity-related protein
VGALAVSSGQIVIELNQIPNQPIRFADEDFGRSEDSLIAKTWDLYIRNREPYSLGPSAGGGAPPPPRSLLSRRD